MANNSESGILTLRDYNIAGNVLRAYYDSDNKLVFVLDSTLNPRKQNVLLVINPVGNRKWDDVLANDYNVDLESVRPKKDNKYQKLDIEYSGLAEYDNLIRAYASGTDLDAALAALDAFRIMSVNRSATERLAAAEATADKARDTISKTNETIADLQVRVKQLRSKLSQQRREIGREPTKQSAAKILRSEAQIDATNEKLSRAKKRLNSAQRRLVAAEEDAAAAREILSQGIGTSIATTNMSVPMQVAPQFTEIATTPQPKAEEEMAEEEVKPLFDKDPEILDEEIAFKPIDFNVTQSSENAATTDAGQNAAAPVFADVDAVAPLSFVPPVAKSADVREENDSEPIVVRPVTPVLETMTAIEQPQEPVQLDPQFTVSDTVVVPEIPAEPVMPVQPMAVQAPAPMPEISPAPATSDLRPVSPIAGGVASVGGNKSSQRPTLLYYVMLVLLIILSVFTLWIYQKSTSDSMPDLTASAKPEIVAPAPVADEQPEPSPFIEAPVIPEPVVEPVVVAPMPEPVVVPEPQPEPVPVEIEQPVAEPEPEPVVAAVEPEPVLVEPVVDGPFLSPEPVQSQPVAEPVVNKPAYNVSQQENMFVAGPDYETDTEYYEDTNVYSAPVVTNDMPTCDDGSLPDTYGCCGDEVYSQMDDGTYLCCANGGMGDCYDPLF